MQGVLKAWILDPVIYMIKLANLSRSLIIMALEGHSEHGIANSGLIQRWGLLEPVSM